MRIILLILIILFCIEATGLILFEIKFQLLYKYRDFMISLNDRLLLIYGENGDYSRIYGEYESVLGKSLENNLRGIEGVILLFFDIIQFVILFISNLLQLCNKCCKICRGVFSLLFHLIVFAYNLLNLLVSFSIKNKINLTDDEIYLFDEQFNNEIKKTLKIFYERKIYMITCLFFVCGAIIAQFVLIIIDLKKSRDEDKKNNENVLEPQVVVFQETDGHRNSNQDDSKNQDTKKN